MANNLYYTKLDAINDNDNKLLFSSDKYDNSGEKYFHLFDVDQIYDIIIKGNTHYYENYNDNEPIKFFLDLDYKKSDKSPDELIIEVINLFTPIFNQHSYQNYPIIILNATTNIKVSLHIIYPTIIFKSAKHIKYFMKTIKSELIYTKIIDTSVYRTGCFRLLYCSKKGKNNKLTHYKSYNYNYTTDKQLFKDTLLKSINNDKYFDFEYNEPIINEHKHIVIENKTINLIQSLCYSLTDQQIINILNLLPDDYNNDYMKWIIVLNVMKGLNKYDIWRDWCRKSDKFNEHANLNYWNKMTNIFIDINYLVYVINTETQNKINYFETYKPYSPLSYIIDHIEDNKCHVSDILTFNQFKKYDTIIIQSQPGTGKTYCVAEYVKKYKHVVISISALVSLINQHIKSFSEINMKSYENKFGFGDNLAICINSIMKLNRMTDKQIRETIIYIDEISSFLLLTHNSTLDYIIKPVYDLLIQIVKKCHKLIISDALINDQCIDFCNIRKTNILCIKNTYPKFKNIKAIKIKNKNDLINKLVTKCKNNEYFLFCSDSKKIVKKYYDICVSQFEDKSNFRIITKDSSYDPKNVNIEWMNKFVFYSPKIVYGVDFTIEQTEDVFIYITGKTLAPPLLFQQCTRCRNMTNLYYMYDCDIEKTKKTYYRCKYIDMNDCEKQYVELLETNNKINDVCRILDEEDNIKFVKNSFFKLFIKNEYMIDCYNSNKFYYFEKTLIENGFILTNYNEHINEHELNDIKKDNIYIDYINSADKNLIEFKTINDRIKFLNLPNDTKLLEKYKDIITDEHKFNEHLDIIRFIKSDKYIENKLVDVMENTFMIKLIRNQYYKIQLLRQLMKHYKIDYFDIKFDKPNLEEIEFDDAKWNLYKHIFRTTKEKPKNHYELTLLLVTMIKQLTCSKMILSKQIKLNNFRFIIYHFNLEYINYHLELDSYNNYNIRDFHDKFINDNDIFID